MWIEHDGSGPPDLPVGALVQARFSHGGIDEDPVRWEQYGDEWIEYPSWSDDLPEDWFYIVAYRVVSAPVTKTASP